MLECTSSELQKGVSKVLAKPENSFEGYKSENSPAPVPKVELETPADEEEGKPTYQLQVLLIHLLIHFLEPSPIAP